MQQSETAAARWTAILINNWVWSTSSSNWIVQSPSYPSGYKRKKWHSEYRHIVENRNKNSSKISTRSLIGLFSSMIRKERCERCTASARVRIRFTVNHTTADYGRTLRRVVSAACSTCLLVLRQDGGSPRPHRRTGFKCGGKNPLCAPHILWRLARSLNKYRLAVLPIEISCS